MPNAGFIVRLKDTIEKEQDTLSRLENVYGNNSLRKSITDVTHTELNFDLRALLDKGKTELEFYGAQTLPDEDKSRNVVNAEINLTERS